MTYFFLREKKALEPFSLTLHTSDIQMPLFDCNLFSSTVLSFRPSEETVWNITFIIVPSSCDQQIDRETRSIKWAVQNGGEEEIMIWELSASPTAESVTFSEVVWGQQWNSTQCSRPFQAWQMVLCIFHAVENLWLRFGWLSSSAWGSGLNAFYTPLQNHMMSDLPAMANCPARKSEEGEEC